jgi:alginate O-acetyltransferase complex protein AlgI
LSFNSAQFLLLFLPIVLIVYYRLSHGRQNAFLVVASCVFYASWDWRFLLPLLCTTSLDYWVSRRLEDAAASGASVSRRRRYLTLSIVANLSLLGFFKYFNFFVASAADLARLLHVPVTMPTLQIILPVAISFYTFQAMSYTIDVYRGELHATRSFWDFFLAVLYFPHLVAGPIQRAANLLPQVMRPRVVLRAQILEGLHLIVWGFFKKVFIADNLAPIVNAVFSQPSPSGGATVLGVYAFAFQIYGDFSGYTDIARGLAKIMGFEFTLNFNLPYFASNPSDFWRRWHISLSSWLRDYLYKSLGGNRQGKLGTYRNLMVTMLLGGLWHGAAWNFVLWGLYHGAILSAHRALAPALAAVTGFFGRLSVLWHWSCVAAMFGLTCYGWLLFRAGSLHQVGAMTAALLHPGQGLDGASMLRVTLIVAPLVVVQWVQHLSGELNFMRLPWIPTPVRVVAYSAMVYLMLFLGGKPQSFVYFRF